MVKPTLPVDIYVRVSRVGKRKGESFISPDEQERRARQHAKEHGLRVGVVVEDLDESGGKLHRPGLTEVLERVERRESGGVIVAWLDRLSRDSEHAHGLLRRIDAAGGKVYAPDAPADATSPEGELQLGIVFAFAQYVRSKARAGFERSKEQAIERGIPVNTRAAVGYRKRDGEGEDRRLEPDPATAPIVRELFERRAAGEGPAALGAFLTAAGVTTSQGSATWSKQAVYGLIRNRIYLGELSYGDPPRFINADAHEPIVDLATWLAAQQPSTSRPETDRAKVDFLLTGLLRCQGCGYSMQATTTSHGHRIYRCTRTHAGGVCPAPARARADAVEAAVLSLFWDWATEVHTSPAEQPEVDLAPLEEALALAERRVVQALAPEVQDAAGEAWAGMIRQRRDERDAAALRLGEAKAETGPTRPPVDAASLHDTYLDLSAADRRSLVADVLNTNVIAVSAGPPKVATIYERGTEPAGLPRRGFKASPTLQAFPDVPPVDATTLEV